MNRFIQAISFAVIFGISGRCPVQSGMSTVPTVKINSSSGYKATQMLGSFNTTEDCARQCLATPGCIFFDLTNDTLCRSLDFGGFRPRGGLRFPQRRENMYQINRGMSLTVTPVKIELGASFRSGYRAAQLLGSFNTPEDCGRQCLAAPDCYYFNLANDTKCWSLRYIGFDPMGSLLGLMSDELNVFQINRGMSTVPTVKINSSSGYEATQMLGSFNTTEDCGRQCLATPGCKFFDLTNDTLCWSLDFGGFNRRGTLRFPRRRENMYQINRGMNLTVTPVKIELGGSSGSGYTENQMLGSFNTPEDCGRQCLAAPDCYYFNLAGDTKCWSLRYIGSDRFGYPLGLRSDELNLFQIHRVIPCNLQQERSNCLGFTDSRVESRLSPCVWYAILSVCEAKKYLEANCTLYGEWFEDGQYQSRDAPIEQGWNIVAPIANSFFGWLLDLLPW